MNWSLISNVKYIWHFLNTYFFSHQLLILSIITSKLLLASNFISHYHIFSCVQTNNDFLIQNFILGMFLKCLHMDNRHRSSWVLWDHLEIFFKCWGFCFVLFLQWGVKAGCGKFTISAAILIIHKWEQYSCNSLSTWAYSTFSHLVRISSKVTVL